MIIRHDVSDALYRVERSEFPALADLPGQGHGVLIADRWVVTAGHAVSGRPLESIMIGERSRPVADVIVHAGYKAAPPDLWQRVLSSRDTAPLEAFAAEIDDIGLLRLSETVRDVPAASVYRGSDEQGQIAEVLGRGATGTGISGQSKDSPRQGDLRRAYQRVVSADARWLVFRFDAPPQALPLAGQPCDGDSGGAVLIESGGRRRLAGIVSHKTATIDFQNYRPCKYGSFSYQTRISRYVPWIESVVGAAISA